jgi:phosphoribosylformylglycinamidine synthase
VKSALGGLGFSEVNSVRQGKVIELDLDEGTDPTQIHEMCNRLLVNAVIESYHLEIV